MSSLESYSGVDLNINFYKYFLVLKRRWLSSLIAFLAVALPIVIYVALKEDTYQATGTILVKSNNATSLTGLNPNATDEVEALGKQSDSIDYPDVGDWFSLHIRRNSSNR